MCYLHQFALSSTSVTFPSYLAWQNLFHSRKMEHLKQEHPMKIKDNQVTLEQSESRLIRISILWLHIIFREWHSVIEQPIKIDSDYYNIGAEFVTV